MRPSRSHLLLKVAAIATVVVAIDQAVKVLVRATIASGGSHRLFPGLELVNIRNTGVAFGLFAGSAGPLIVLTASVLALLGILFLRAERDIEKFTIPAGLLLGGALGNLVDRVSRGAVTDYLDPVLWPAFNLADTVIVLGVAGLVLEAFSPDNQTANQRE